MGTMTDLKVLFINDEDLLPNGIKIAGLPLKSGDHLVREADLIIHQKTGVIYKSRWSTVPKRTCDKDLHCWLDRGYSRNAMVGALAEGIEECKHCGKKRKKIEQPQWRYEDIE